MTSGKSQSSRSASNSEADSWTADVVEGAAAARAASSGTGSDNIVHEVGGDDDELVFSSPVPDEADAEPAEADDLGAEVNPSEVANVDDGATQGGADGTESSSDKADSEMPEVEVSVEGLIADLERVTEEKNQYLDASRRLQADFENYRKRVGKDTIEAKSRAKEAVVSELLNVLDACDGAVSNGSEEIEPIRAALLSALANQGLRRIDPVDAPFDPSEHEAVAHEPGDKGESATVAEVMRVGYGLEERIIRPAMVRVRG